ncbi:MAG: DUF1684 domain-containing protein [Chloroflexota bacterium]
MAVLNPIQITDWRRTVSATYADIRQHNSNPHSLQEAWGRFRRTRDDLFAHHPMTPLTAEQRENFSTIPFYDYDPDYAVWGTMNIDVEAYTLDAQLEADGLFKYTRVAEIAFELKGEKYLLNMFMIEGYGGALYLPFADATNGQTTYGGGRYLYDAIKGADLGSKGDQILFDFNFAYNPSCAYNYFWSCPLPPAENRLPISIEAGEKAFS